MVNSILKPVIALQDQPQFFPADSSLQYCDEC